MANSGIYIIDVIFNWSVRALYVWAKYLGVTYEEINVWLFCVAWPLATLAMLLMSWKLWHSNRALHRQIKGSA